MNQAKTKRKSLFVAHGRYDYDGFDTKVYQFTKVGVSEWAWCGWNNPLPPKSLSLREVRRRCWEDTKNKTAMYQAHFAGVQRRPKLGKIQRLLDKRGGCAVRHDFKLLEQALFALGTARAAARWLTQPAVEFGGAIPFMVATQKEGWWRVLHVLLRFEYKHLLCAPK